MSFISLFLHVIAAFDSVCLDSAEIGDTILRFWHGNSRKDAELASKPGIPKYAQHYK